MKAIRVHEFGGPEKLKLDTDVPIPTPGKSEVLIKVKAIGINPVETYIRTGGFPIKPDLPYIPGTDVSGIVEQVGSDVTTFKVGDRVYTCWTASGSYCEYATAEEIHCNHLHENLSFNQGAAMGVPYCTAAKALLIRAQAKAGQTLLVHGASGAVGMAAVQLALGMGLKVAGTAGTPQGMEMVKSLGADFVFNHKDSAYVEHIKEAIGEFDIIFELLTNVNLEKDVGMIKMFGKILVVGSRGRTEFNPTELIPKEASILGVLVWNTTPEQYKEIHSTLAAAQKDGSVNPRISAVYSLAEASKAHHDIMNSSGATGKLIVDLSK